MGPLILTYTGKHVNPLDVRPADVCKEDVAHALSLVNRFAGHTRKPITVAQHAVYVSRLLEGTGLEWDGLHHDDGEAYVGDMTKWLKECEEMSKFREAEERAQWACYEAFSVVPEHYMGTKKLMHPLVEEADRLMVRFELREGFSRSAYKAWFAMVRDCGITTYPLVSEEEIKKVGPWKPWSWRQAEEAWLTRFRSLEDRPATRRYQG